MAMLPSEVLQRALPHLSEVYGPALPGGINLRQQAGQLGRRVKGKHLREVLRRPIDKTRAPGDQPRHPADGLKKSPADQRALTSVWQDEHVAGFEALGKRLITLMGRVDDDIIF